jgi:beta-lactam-binding protein with PASTA domain
MNPNEPEPTEIWTNLDSPDPNEPIVTPIEEETQAINPDDVWPVRPEAAVPVVPVERVVTAPEPFVPARPAGYVEEVARPWYRCPAGLSAAMGVLALLGVLVLLLATGVFKHDPKQQAVGTTTTTGAIASSNTTQLVVPEVKGMRVAEAKARLAQTGIKVDSVRALTAPKPQGIIVGEAPASGEKISRNKGVTLYVSSGYPVKVVPSVTGLSLPQAMKSVHGAGFNAKTSTAFSNSVKKGNIISQTPQSGTKQRSNIPVRLSVSKGVEVISVPNFVGQDQTSAQSAASGAGLKTTIRQVTSTVTAAQVLDQKPQAGAKVRRNATVALIVAKAQAKPTATTTTATTTNPTQTTTITPAPTAGQVVMPRVMGMTRAQATSKLHAMGLTMTTTSAHSSAPSGQIISQDPAPGVKLQKGDHVTMVVSSGPTAGSQSATIPDVTGMSEADARSQLTTAGFSVNVVYEPTDAPDQQGNVIDQSPPGASQGHQGDSVTIYVGQSPTSYNGGQ